MKLIGPLMAFFVAGILAWSCDRSPAGPSPVAHPAFRLLKLHYKNSLGEEAVTQFHYNHADQNYMATWYLTDSSRSSVNRHSLDPEGRMVGKHREFSDSLITIQHYRYDEDGNLVWEDFNRSDGVTGEVDYDYGQDGRILSADCRGLNGWFHGEIIYKWNDGLRTGADLMQDSARTGNIVYEYSGGRLVYEKWDFPGKWNQEFRYEYQDAAAMTYTSPNVHIRENPWFRIVSENYDFNGESGGPSYYTYDASGIMTAKEFVRSDGVSTLSKYSYDSTGLLDLSGRVYVDGRTTDFLYWYSVDRDLLVKTFQWSDGTSGSETYRYEDGRLARGEYVNMDGWLTGMLTYEYDEEGILRSADYEGEDGMDASVGYYYDLDFNLVRIHWLFSSGHTQTYHFSYGPNK